jgi:hypothetical protein
MTNLDPNGADGLDSERVRNTRPEDGKNIHEYSRTHRTPWARGEAPRTTIN